MNGLGNGLPTYGDNTKPTDGNLVPAPHSNTQSGRVTPSTIGGSSFLNRPIATKPTANTQDRAIDSRPTILNGRRPSLTVLDGVLI